MQKIANDLDAHVTAIYWCGTSYVICSALFQPIFATLAALGRKVSTFIAITFILLGSILCAVAHSVSILIIGRCLQGIGSGGVTVVTRVLLADLFERDNRVMMSGFIGLTWVIGTTCGPLMGGGFASRASWVRHSVYLSLGNIWPTLTNAAMDVLDQSSSLRIQLCHNLGFGATYPNKGNIHGSHTTC